MSPEPPGLRVIDVVAAERRALDEDRGLAKVDRDLAAAHLARVYRDDLTGAMTRRPGRECLEREIARARRAGTPLAVAFFDVNGLKQVNDDLGHASGDRVLEAVGTALVGNLRPYDLVIRYGGDEFVCGFPESTRADAEASIERVVHSLEELLPGTTMSVGVAELRDDDSLDRLIGRADHEMYQSRTTAPVDLSPGPTDSLPVLLCGDCECVLDVEHVLDATTGRASRTATCGGCGHRTLIQLRPQGRGAAVAERPPPGAARELLRRASAAVQRSRQPKRVMPPGPG